MPAQPRLSILIPNYNNGRASSCSGRRDFIGDLLRSIDETLRADPTSYEVLIADDGSTDDSPGTIRSWLDAANAKRSHADAEFRFFPLEHRGIVSRCMNLLLQEARGEIFCRFDGDIIIHTPNWASVLCAKFDRADPRLGIIGAKQLTLNGLVHSMGDWILHPRGYHHIGQGAPRGSFSTDIEVDHVMGCFYACRRSVYDDVGDYDESILRGQTIDWTVSARARGWRVMCTPEIEFTHCHSERAWRANQADTPDGLNQALDRFRAKWGFDRLAPNLDDAWASHQDSPLLWNEQVFNERLRNRAEQTLDARGTMWARLGASPATQTEVTRRVRCIAGSLSGQVAERDLVIHLGCGDGLITHLLAEQGVRVVGVEERRQVLSLARELCGRAATAHAAPEILLLEDAIETTELKTRARVVLIDCLERHPNPVALLEAAHRLLAENGLLLVVTSERTEPGSGLYRPHELNAQVSNTRLFQLETAATHAADGLLVVTAAPASRGTCHDHFRTEIKGEKDRSRPEHEVHAE